MKSGIVLGKNGKIENLMLLGMARWKWDAVKMKRSDVENEKVKIMNNVSGNGWKKWLCGFISFWYLKKICIWFEMEAEEKRGGGRKGDEHWVVKGRSNRSQIRLEIWRDWGEKGGGGQVGVKD
jgi:hypothetical protein